MAATNRARSLSSSSRALNLTANSNLGSMISLKGFLKLLKNSLVTKPLPLATSSPSLFMREGSMAKIASCTPYFSKVTCSDSTNVRNKTVPRPLGGVQETGTHLVVEKEVHKARNTLGELRQLPHGLHRGALAAVKNVDADLLGEGSAGKQLAPHKAALSLPEGVHVVDDEGLKGANVCRDNSPGAFAPSNTEMLSNRCVPTCCWFFLPGCRGPSSSSCSGSSGRRS